MKEWFKKTFCYDVKVNKPFYKLVLDSIEFALINPLIFGAILYYLYPQKLDNIIKILETLKEIKLPPSQIIIPICVLIFVINWTFAIGAIVSLSSEQDKQEKLKKKKKTKE